MYNWEKIVQLLKEIVFIAGKRMVERDEKTLLVNEKTSSKDLVTLLDVEIQKFIIKECKEKYPEACFVAEEMDNNEENLCSELTFVIDPIDGTANFVKDTRHSCISIACFSKRELMAGVVYNPYMEELFWAMKGQGSYLNEKRIRVSEQRLCESLVFFGTSPYDSDMAEDTFAKLKMICSKCLDIRRLGSAALDICSVACGRAGLYFEGKLSLWDYAAAALILQEAGGVILNYKGETLNYSLEKSSIISGSKLTIEEADIVETGGCR